MHEVSSRAANVALPTDEQILITREFAAPPPLVYRAWTTPELVRQWWTARRGTMTVCEIDLRVGGAWRFAMQTPDGIDVAFHGEYRELSEGERLVSTEVYEGAPDAGATLNTASFEPSGDGTLLRLTIDCPGREVRDQIIASGMEDGLQDALELLEQAALSLR